LLNSTWLTHHYDSIGNLIKTVVGGVTTTMEYDIRGNKTKMNDPDMGTWTYSYNALIASYSVVTKYRCSISKYGKDSYNALGKLVSQTDAKGQTSTMAYDKLGRMTQRTEAIMMCEPCTLRFINTNNFANDVFGGGFFMS
jgi:YD repeat-containing protein